MIVINLMACSEPKLHDAPHQQFFQVGLLGHGRGAIGDLQLNSFYFERQCDSCHANETDKHGALGRCNICHQPHIAGWSKSFLVRDHQVFLLTNKPHHNQLSCIDCHQTLTQRDEFNKTSCQHCHNHQQADIDYAHDLMDDYDYTSFSQPQACLSCHSRNGINYRQHFDFETGEGL
ncbi:MAG: hypothetical protein V7765_12980 [Oleispira sp.]